jgi:hypothetical protein
MKPSLAGAADPTPGRRARVALVLTNRSAPPATVTPVLVYPDVRAAVAWLESAFGFGERVRIGDAHRAQLRVGTDGSVVVADVHGDQVAPSPGPPPDRVCCERPPAVRAGDRSAIPLAMRKQSLW